MYTVSSDGFRIAYDAQGSGPALLLLHGFGNDRTSWSNHGWVERLQSQYMVITMDLRGCGESTGSADPEAYTVEPHLADVYAVMDACKIDDFRLCGWSFGATIGLYLAARSPRVVQAVVAGSLFGHIFTEEWVEPRVKQLERLVSAQADGGPDQLDLSPHERALAARTDLPAYLARVRALGTWPAVEPRDLRCPTLVYTGTEDGNIVSRLEEQRAAIEAAGHRLHVFDSFNHLQLLSELDTVFPVIRSFFHC